MLQWDKNPTYPTLMANCRECGQWGPVKLAWDLRGHLCLDAKTCLARTNNRIQELTADASEAETQLLRSVSFNQPTKIMKEIKPSTLQSLTCEQCGSGWTRELKRGRVPKICSSCKGV